MVLRTIDYGAAAARQAIELDRAAGREPREFVVESLVLHHGPGRWTAPATTAELLHGSDLSRYQLVEPWIRDASGEVHPQAVDLPRVLLGLARKWTMPEMAEQLGAVRRALAGTGSEHLDRHLAGVMRTMLESRNFPQALMEEETTMDAVVATFQRSMDDLVRQGLRTGRREGRERGVEEGSRAIVRRLVERRFGAAVAAKLEVLLGQATSRQIDQVADLVVDCAGSEDFLAGVRGALSPESRGDMDRT